MASTGLGDPPFLACDQLELGALQAQLRRAWPPNATVGATNGGFTNDIHPCLPGLPDDEVDVMLHALARRARRFAGGATPVSNDALAAPPDYSAVLNWQMRKMMEYYRNINDNHRYLIKNLMRSIGKDRV